MLVAGETLIIFILTGISNMNIFFIKKKKHVVVYSNIHDKFASTNLTYSIKKKRKNLKLDITQFFLLQTNRIYFQLIW